MTLIMVQNLTTTITNKVCITTYRFMLDPFKWNIFVRIWYERKFIFLVLQYFGNWSRRLHSEFLKVLHQITINLQTKLLKKTRGEKRYVHVMKHRCLRKYLAKTNKQKLPKAIFQISQVFILANINYSSKQVTAAPDVLSWEICLQVCKFIIFCIVFLRQLVKHIENKNQSVKSNFAALKNCILFNVSMTKTK